MANKNIETIAIAAEKLMKLSQSVNRGSAKSQGFYDGRVLPRTEDNEKQVQYLRL